MGDDRILVTGGTGFVGGHLVEALLGAGRRVRCLVRRGSRHEQLERAGAELAFGALDDEEALRRACEGCGTIYHLAGATRMVRLSDFFRVNAQGTHNVVAAAAAAGGRPRFIHVSSLAAAGPSREGTPRVETDVPEPASAYGRSKLQGEEAVRASGLPFVIVRPPVVYGPRDRDVYAFFRVARLGLAPRLGGIDRSMSLVHVSDLVAGLMLAAGAPAGSTYFIADPTPYTWDAIMTTIAETLGKKVLRFWIPVFPVRIAAGVSQAIGRVLRKPMIFNCDKLKELAFPHWTCSSRKAIRELGFSPAFDLRRGIAQTTAWYREQGWL